MPKITYECSRCPTSCRLSGFNSESNVPECCVFKNAKIAKWIPVEYKEMTPKKASSKKIKDSTVSNLMIKLREL